MLLLYLSGSSTKNILILLGRSLYNLVLKIFIDGDAKKFLWYTGPVFNSPFS